jgi:hypothetical protein
MQQEQKVAFWISQKAALKECSTRNMFNERSGIPLQAHGADEHPPACCMYSLEAVACKYAA